MRFLISLALLLLSFQSELIVQKDWSGTSSRSPWPDGGMQG